MQRRTGTRTTRRNPQRTGLLSPHSRLIWRSSKRLPCQPFYGRKPEPCRYRDLTRRQFKSPVGEHATISLRVPRRDRTAGCGVGRKEGSSQPLSETIGESRTAYSCASGSPTWALIRSASFTVSTEGAMPSSSASARAQAAYCLMAWSRRPDAQ